MSFRRRYALLALPLALAMAACTSSSTSGKGQTASAGSTGGASVSSAPSGGSGTPADAAGLGRRMQSAVRGIQTAHISLNVDAAGQQLSGAGDEKLSNGRLVGMDLTESLPGGAGSIEIIIINNRKYAKLPSSMNTSGKPYVLITAQSSNPVVKELAGSLDSALSSASVGSVSAFVTAADSVTVKGSESVEGVATTHYSVVVDVAKLPASLPGKDALVSSGLKTLPIELYIDSAGRPVQVTEHFAVSGQTVSTDVKVTRYNEPVTITEPPADQVSTD
jgi:hypothetical protein